MASASTKVSSLKETASGINKNGANPPEDENLDQIRDARQRKKIQNRIAQRTYRKKVKERLESFDQWQDSVANAFLDQSQPSQPNLSPFPSTITSNGIEGNKEISRKANPRSPPNSGFSPSSGPERPPISWTPTFDPLLSMPELPDGTYQSSEIISTTEPFREHQRAMHSDPSLTIFDEPPSIGRSNSSTASGSLLSTLSMPSRPRNESTQSSNPSSEPDGGKTALHLAAEKGEHMIVCMMLDRMCDINAQDSCDRTALHLAVENRHSKVVEALLAKRHSVNVQDRDGQTALHVAVAAGEERIMELLLQADVDLEMKDNAGRTALHIGVQMGNAKTVQQLLNKGANILARIS